VDGPVLVDAVVDREELTMPPKITLEMAKGFRLFTLRLYERQGNGIVRDRRKQSLAVKLGRLQWIPSASRV
jgi:hypothetical protein